LQESLQAWYTDSQFHLGDIHGPDAVAPRKMLEECTVDKGARQRLRKRDAVVMERKMRANYIQTTRELKVRLAGAAATW
jgi:hypothetical protein